MLRGRETEQAAIGTFLQRARDGRGGGLVVCGEPGMGKSALLAYARGRSSGMRVLATAGVEPEAELGYATLHRLLVPVLDRLDRLPEPQAGALRVVFAQRQGPVPDRFLVALATLSLLSELADDRPLLCLVDDAHWADRASLDTLGFVARRLDAEPIAMLLAARTAAGISEAAAGLADLPLTGLPEEAARALLREHGGDRLSPADRDELLSASGGNPLAIGEFATLTRQPVGWRRPRSRSASSTSWSRATGQRWPSGTRSSARRSTTGPVQPSGGPPTGRWPRRWRASPPRGSDGPGTWRTPPRVRTSRSRPSLSGRRPRRCGTRVPPPRPPRWNEPPS